MKRFLLICLILFTAGSLLAQTPTVASLTTTSGAAIQWYSAATGGTLYTGTEALVNGQHDLCKPNDELHRKCNMAGCIGYNKLIRQKT